MVRGSLPTAHAQRSLVSPNSNSTLDDPKHGDAADGIRRNRLAPIEGGLGGEIRSRKFPGDVNRRGNYRHDQADKKKLPEFDTDIEKKESDRDGVLWQTHFA